jgi:hypothetical protein
MKSIGQVLIGVLLVGSAASARADQLFDIDTEAGAGYADNLNLATASSGHAGSSFLFANGALATAAATDTGGTEAFAELGAGGTLYLDYSDLSWVRAHARIGLRREFGSSWGELTGVGALKGYNDSTRDAIDLSGKAALGQRVSPIFAWRAEDRFLDRDAEVETFDYQQHRGSVFAIVGPGRTDLSLGYRFEVGQSALYMSLEESQTPKGQARGRRTANDTFGDDQVAYRDDTHSHAALAALNFRPNRWLRFSLAYEIAVVVTSDGNANAQEIAASVHLF